MYQLGESRANPRGATMNYGEAWLVADSCARQCVKRGVGMGLAPAVSESFVVRAREKLTEVLNECESPIERRMLAALAFANYGNFASFPAELHLPKKSAEPPRGDLVIIPQFAFVKMRLDFAIIGELHGVRKFVAVECDGEEYHTDADKDRLRDNYLRGFGFEVFRFRGADIQADPLPLATQVGMHLADWRASLEGGNEH